jgi:NADH dehydrogenase [ubiquinone] 1 alpha subcomplex assembly factor 6
MMALRALNLETAAIKSHIQNSSTAQLRLAWWKQAIDKCYQGESSGHHVTDLLVPAIKEAKLTKGWFTRFLEGRARDLNTAQPRALSDLERYTEDVHSSLVYLGLESMGIRDLNADHAASHIGKAMGLVTLIKALPYHSKAREVYIPTELTAKHNITSEMLFRAEFTPEIGEAIYEIASLAHGHIEMARELIPSLPEKANTVLLPTVRSIQTHSLPLFLFFSLISVIQTTKSLTLPFV